MNPMFMENSLKIKIKKGVRGGEGEVMEGEKEP